MEKVYLYIAAVDDLDLEAVLPLLSESRREYVLRCQNEQTKRQRAAGALLCAYALRELGETVSLPLEFTLREDGKPYLSGSRWNFNLSHSGSYVCCALSDALQIGADIEKMVERDYKALATHFCSEQEYRRLFCRAPKRWQSDFYEFWARKEALAKRDGVPQKNFKKVDVTKWHVCCFEEQGYMHAVAADKAFELIVRRVGEKWLDFARK